MAATLFDKIWASHRVRSFDDDSALIYLDRIFLHERTGSIALASLRAAGREVANPAQAFATVDHIVDTYAGRGDTTSMPNGTAFIKSLREGTRRAGIRFFDLDDSAQGISHMIAAEQGIALPGLTMICPDSHTCTLGALGVLAIGVGTGDCEHALATEVLRLKKPPQMRIWLDGELDEAVSAKDVILHLIARYGADGGQRAAIEFAGPAVSAMPMNQRFTLCNMAVEFSAYTGLIAPDAKTLAYVEGRHYAPKDAELALARQNWSDLRTDPDARFDTEIRMDCADITPQISWGTSPEHSMALTATIPDPAQMQDGDSAAAAQKALAYMDLKAGQSLIGVPIDAVFIGSCTNARLTDLLAVAEILRGRRVAAGVKAICVPGSTPTRLAAEAEGIDKVFTDAGFEWREAGCSLCFFAGGEGFAPGERVVSTTNRNFEGRQGPGVRTHLASPQTAAVAALNGAIAATVAT